MMHWDVQPAHVTIGSKSGADTPPSSSSSRSSSVLGGGGLRLRRRRRCRRWAVGCRQTDSNSPAVSAPNHDGGPVATTVPDAYVRLMHTPATNMTSTTTRAMAPSRSQLTRGAAGAAAGAAARPTGPEGPVAASMALNVSRTLGPGPREGGWGATVAILVGFILFCPDRKKVTVH